LIALGFNFSMMREWRGSLIAPMTAHLLHNGTLLTLVILLFKAVSG
jgi:membrane protease YdiL (CAAX protease family)